MVDRVQAVDRALLLLEEIAASPEPLTTPELARRAGVNRATAWRLLNSLEHRDLVERDPSTQRFHIGYGALRIARARSLEAFARRARPTLVRLAEDTRGGVYLVVSSAGGSVIVDEIKAPGPLLVDLANVTVPLHCGSVGKMILSTWKSDEVDGFLEQPLEQVTPETITDPVALRRCLEEARRTGVTFNYGEHHPDWCGLCVMIRDRAARPLAFLNVTLPTVHTSHDALRSLAPRMIEAAAEIESRIHSTHLPVS